jgi:hypothetical protein
LENTNRCLRRRKQQKSVAELPKSSTYPQEFILDFGTPNHPPLERLDSEPARGDDLASWMKKQGNTLSAMNIFVLLSGIHREFDLRT